MTAPPTGELRVDIAQGAARLRERPRHRARPHRHLPRSHAVCGEAPPTDVAIRYLDSLAGFLLWGAYTRND